MAITKIVSPKDIRKLFSESGYAERLEKGELRSVLKKNTHPTSPKAPVPFCTRSQLVVYLDGKKAVAIVHQYLKPDGKLGASGKPDPKWLVHAGTTYQAL